MATQLAARRRRDRSRIVSPANADAAIRATATRPAAATTARQDQR